jgi:cell division cycle 2-like protein
MNSDGVLQLAVIPDMNALDATHAVSMVTSGLVSYSDTDDDVDDCGDLVDTVDNDRRSNDSLSPPPPVALHSPTSHVCANNESKSNSNCPDIEMSHCDAAIGSSVDCPLRSVHEFKCLRKIEEGVHGAVYKATDKKTGELVAIKRLKLNRKKDCSVTSLREIKALLRARHENVVSLKSIVVHKQLNDQVYLVMEYMDHDLTSFMKIMDRPFSVGQVKSLMVQLLRGVGHIHDKLLIHRDLKPTNLLLNQDGVLKIGDFGLSREYGAPEQPYTPIVVTLWYRSPELLLGAKSYGTPIDMWSVGCIFSEMLYRKPLFRGKSEISQIAEIIRILGNPNDRIWPGVSGLPLMKNFEFAKQPFNKLRHVTFKLSDPGFTLLNRFLAYKPARRITAREALQSEYFQEDPVPELPSTQRHQVRYMCY